MFEHNDCPGEESFCSLQVVSGGLSQGGGGVVMDEIDTCIIVQ